jgi:hypothetical protein
VKPTASARQAKPTIRKPGRCIVPKTYKATSFTEDFAKFLASRPPNEDMLAYRPPLQAQKRAQQLLRKQNDGDISYEEEQELGEFAHAERLIRLIKALFLNPALHDHE